MKAKAGLLTALLAICGYASAQTLGAQSRFEVVSVRTCKASDLPASGSGRSGAGRIIVSPGRLRVECMTVDDLIREAFLLHPDGKPWPVDQSGFRRPPISNKLLEQKIKGSIPWVDSDRYTIDAKAEGTPIGEMMRGPMMQSLLAERFMLKIHRESRTMPIYELRVTKGGPKIERAIAGGCITVGRDHPPPFPVAGKPIPKVCGGWAGDSVYGTTMANLCRQISVFSDREVVDKTGVDGLFDIHFDLSALPPKSDSVEPAIPSPPADSAFFGAIQSSIPGLGLRLVPGKASSEFLVIDRVGKPSEN